MARPPEAPAPAPPPRAGLPVIEVLDAFLEWCRANREPRTFDWYRDRLQMFADAIPDDLDVAELRPFHVTRVMDTRGAKWTNNGKHNLARAVQRAMNWAERQGMIDRSPIRHVEKPAMEARELCATPADFAEAIAAIEEPRFAELVRFAWESGARPQEIVAIEARHVDFEQRRVAFPRKESKGKRAMRLIYLTPEAAAILRPLVEKNATGLLFRNSRGQPWRHDSINCAFCRLAGKIGKKLHLGAFRKGFATEALKNGVDVISLPHLMGHRDSTMLSRVYARVEQDRDHMIRAAERAKKPNSPG